MPQILELQFKLAKIFGVPEHPSMKMERILKIVNFCAVFLIFYSAILFFIFIHGNYSNLVDLTEAITGAITNILALTKLLFLLVCSKDIFKFVGDLRMLNQKCEYLIVFLTVNMTVN
jgi:hypothetical protein